MTGVLLVLFLFLGVVFLWVARTVIVDFWSRRFDVPRETPWLPNYWHARALGGAVIFFVLAGVMGYHLVQESRAPLQLANFIPVYPGITGTTVVPKVGADRHWLFESNDPPSDIASFYETLGGESDWSVQRSGDEDRVSLEMERDGTEVFLFVSRDGKQSQLMYRIKQQEEN